MIVRKDYISRLEKEVDIPEELTPERIKEMLDKKAAGPVIDGKGSAYEDAVSSRTKIKMNGIGSIVARTLTAAAAFVILIGGAAIIKLNIDHKAEIQTNAKDDDKTAAVTAEDDGLIGLRKGNYESLYRYMLDADETEHEASVVDGSYALIKDENFSQTDKNEISWQFRSLVDADALYCARPSVIPLTEDYSERAKDGDYIISPKLVQQYGDTAFAAASTDVCAYKLDAEKTKKINYDLWKDTYFRNTLGKDKEKNAQGHTLTPFVTGLYISGDKLIMTFGFHIVNGTADDACTAAYSGVCVYDISDTANISLIYEYEQPGSLRDTVLYKDNRFVMVSVYDNGRKAMGNSGHETDTADYLPEIYDNGTAEAPPAESIYLANKGKADELTFVSSFTLDDVSCRTGSALFAGCLNNVLVDETTVLLYSCQVTDSGVTKGHLTKLDVSDGLEVEAAGYLESGTAAPARLSSFSEANDNYFIADDMTGIFALGSTLESLGGYSFNKGSVKASEDSPYADGGALTLTIVDNYVTLQGDKAYVYHYNDASAYSWENNSDDIMNTLCVCKRIIDLSDPSSPQETQIDDPADAPCIYRETRPEVYLDYGIGSIVLNGEDMLKVESSLYSLGDILGRDQSYTPATMNVSLNRASSKLNDKFVLYRKSKDNKTTIGLCSFDPKDSFPGECNVFNMQQDDIVKEKVNMFGVLDTESFEGRISRVLLSPVEYYSEENSLIFLPMASDTETALFMDSQTVGETSSKDNDGSCCVAVISLDKNTGELTQLGKFPLTVGTDEDTANFGGMSRVMSHMFTGSACYEDNLYVFSTCGVSCTPLNDSTESLYAESYS